MLPPTSPVPGPSGLDAMERRALALAYVVARAAGTLRRGGALELWGRNAAGDSLDRLALVLAAMMRRDPAAAVQAMSSLRLGSPQADRTLRSLTGSLRQCTRPAGYK